MKKALIVVASVAVASSTSACGIMGVRSFEVFDGGPRWEFSEGTDFHFGANAIDTVHDQRGVTPRPPKQSTKKTAVTAPKGSGAIGKAQPKPTPVPHEESEFMVEE